MAQHRSPAVLRLGAGSHVTTARNLIFVAALVSFVLSISLWFGGNQLQGIFVGLWVPSILALGAIVAPRRAGP